MYKRQVFDPARIADRATYDAPLAHPEGIRYVFVNGRLVLQDGTFTAQHPGRALRRAAPAALAAR